MIKLEAKSKHLTLNLEIKGDSITNQVFSNPRFQLSKRLQAVSLGIRSELIMFLMEVEKETRLE